MANLDRVKKMNDAGIQNWLRMIDVQDLKNALPGVDAETKNRIFNNLSDRAVSVLQESINAGTSKDIEILVTSINKLDASLENIR
jgi:flagellar motor switch protein FliG